MADRSASEYEALRRELARALQEQKRAEEQQRQAEEQQRQAEQELHQEATLREQAEERTQETTLDEYLAACHSLLSVPLRVACPSRSTKGSIPAPTGKYCPTRFREWSDFASQQAGIYTIVRRYLQPAGTIAPRLFSPLLALEDLGRSLCSKPLSSEKDLEGVERYGKDRHVHDIVSALCRNPAAREELRLGHGFRFDSHANALDEEASEGREGDTASGRMQPDQFCVHRLDDDSSTLLMTVEYKPPHKLSTESLCAGLRPMDFWEEVVNSETIPTDRAEKLRYNAARLTGAAIVQEYHVMIQEGLAYSCLSTGIALVFLYVPEEEPTTLYYHLCVPNEDVRSMGEESYHQPVTAVARLLCLGLMSCATSLRSNAWRNRAKGNLHIWETNFEYTRSQIPDEQLNQTPPGSEYVPSSPIESPKKDVRRRNTRSHPVCAPSPGASLERDDPSDSSDSDRNRTASRHKRNYSQITSSPPQSRHQRPMASRRGGDDYNPRKASPFCTQRCLLGLQQNGLLDDACPNVSCHRRGQNTDKHPVTASELVCILKRQLDKDVDHHCEPLGGCGATGAPFRLRCESLGYTIVGKGTTSRLWTAVSREAHFYHVLRRAQGSAIPVFLGSINMLQSYFLHGAGEIQHMLLMAWGGEPLTRLQWQDDTQAMEAVKKSHARIRQLGVRHGDVRRQNTLWNAELERVLIIDFDKAELITRQAGALKRKTEPSFNSSAKRSRLIT